MLTKSLALSLLSLSLLSLTLAAPSALAQARQTTFAPSGRATSEISVSGGALIRVDYGQPHARGREVFGSLVPLDTVWRAGANRATQLTTDVALAIGATRLPPGNYTLAMVPSRTAPQLVINGRTRQWGIPYRADGEIARVPMRVEMLAQPVETFTITLLPNPARAGAAAPAPGTGSLVMTWGTMQFSVDFSAQP